MKRKDKYTVCCYHHRSVACDVAWLMQKIVPNGVYVVVENETDNDERTLHDNERGVGLWAVRAYGVTSVWGSDTLNKDWQWAERMYLVSRLRLSCKHDPILAEWRFNKNNFEDVVSNQRQVSNRENYFSKEMN